MLVAMLQELQESADRLKHLEVEYKDAVSQLSDKQRQFERLQEVRHLTPRPSPLSFKHP